MQKKKFRKLLFHYKHCIINGSSLCNCCLVFLLIKCPDLTLFLALSFVRPHSACCHKGTTLPLCCISHSSRTEFISKDPAFPYFSQSWRKNTSERPAWATRKGHWRSESHSHQFPPAQLPPPQKPWKPGTFQLSSSSRSWRTSKRMTLS